MKLNRISVSMMTGILSLSLGSGVSAKANLDSSNLNTHLSNNQSISKILNFERQEEETLIAGRRERRRARRQARRQRRQLRREARHERRENRRQRRMCYRYGSRYCYSSTYN